MLDVMRALAHGYPAPVVERVLPSVGFGAGAELSITVPGQSVWIPVALTAVYTSSAVAGARTPYLQVFAENARLLGVQPTETLPANTVTIITWCDIAYNAAGIAAPTILTLPMPRIVMLPGWSFATFTGGLDVGDSYGPVTLTVLEMFATGPGDHHAHEHDLVDRLASSIATRLVVIPRQP